MRTLNAMTASAHREIKITQSPWGTEYTGPRGLLIEAGIVKPENFPVERKRVSYGKFDQHEIRITKCRGDSYTVCVWATDAERKERFESQRRALWEAQLHAKALQNLPSNEGHYRRQVESRTEWLAEDVMRLVRGHGGYCYADPSEIEDLLAEVFQAIRFSPVLFSKSRREATEKWHRAKADVKVAELVAGLPKQ